MFISTRGGFDKVVFLVDRRDLDTKTVENFRSYSSYEPVVVDDTRFTYILENRLRESTRGIVITTTFKLNSLVKDLIENDDYSIANKKIMFIIDEAHRTTMGQMMGTIKKYFKKNGYFYGFTGTPLFEENKVQGKINEKSEVINTTEKLFGPLLHRYTIDEAIAEGNVLGFHVSYVNTGEFKSHEWLREKIFEQILSEKPQESEWELDKRLSTWSDLKIEEEAKKRNLLVYDDEVHIPRVVSAILENWEVQSKNRKFNAILSVAYRKRVFAYFEEFEKQMREKDMELNIAMTISFGSDEDEFMVNRDLIEKMFESYAKFTGLEFSLGDKYLGESNYLADIVIRSTRGGSGRNPKNIDLIIVADQLLTGYDNKYLNTLYVDRSLELQGLVQAYSRTNRVFGSEKEFGSVINYQYPAITHESVKKALILYGSGGSSSRAIVEPYNTAVEKFSIAVERMRETLPEPSDWQSLESDAVAKEDFISHFKETANLLNRVNQYYEYHWDDTTFGIDEHTWLKYVGAFKNLTKKNEGLDDLLPTGLVGRTKISGSEVIDAAYIMKLISSKIKSIQGIQTIDAETLRIIYEQIQELSDMGDYEQAKLIKEFVDTELVAGHLPSGRDFDELFEEWKKDKLHSEINEFAAEWGFNSELLVKSIEHYNFYQPNAIPYIEDLTRTLDYNSAKNKTAGNRLKNIINLNDILPEWISELKHKFDTTSN